MEGRQDLASILPLLPLTLSSSSLIWPPRVVDFLKKLSLGPDISRVCSGKMFFDAITELRISVGLSEESLAFNAAFGYSIFFDQLISGDDSRVWFCEVVPFLAHLLLMLPSLLESHYRYSDTIFCLGNGGLRVLGSQESGIVLLSQELIAALLACSLFCLFPQTRESNLPMINFDCLFAGLYPDSKMSQRGKIKCLVHYFKRVCSSVPTGFVSFERKVLPVGCSSLVFWSESATHLCPFKVSVSGFIEDQPYEAVEVDFANKFLGGGALSRGCVQEEIRFMINPELIAGMLFLAAMEKNEAIEIIGTERFSDYAGYASTFCFVGDHKDMRLLDSLRRRKRKIVAIDALCHPGMRQFKIECLLRETNKAFCGFLDQSDYGLRFKSTEKIDICETQLIHGNGMSNETTQVSESTAPIEVVGIATGNWGCGAFGGDPELKCIIQWLAASQAHRPFILYYTFGQEPLQRLEEVTQWILQHEWSVGDLWNMLAEYSPQRLSGGTSCGFLNWLLPKQNFL